MTLRDWIDKQPNRNGKVIRDLAEQLGVTHEAVNQWVYKRLRVPAERCKDVERVTGGEVRAEQLRPDVFADREPAA